MAERTPVFDVYINAPKTAAQPGQAASCSGKIAVDNQTRAVGGSAR